MEQNFWKKCSVCKKELPFGRMYYVCSVSGCNKKRAPSQFCSVSCWDSHNGILNHRDAGAEDAYAPTKDQYLAMLATQSQDDNEDSDESDSEERPRRRIIVSSKPSTSAASDGDSSDEVLVVVSKLKAYIKNRSDMNTAADVMPILSDLLRRECDRAIEHAKQAGRKTVMARDF